MEIETVLAIALPLVIGFFVFPDLIMIIKNKYKENKSFFNLFVLSSVFILIFNGFLSYVLFYLEVRKNILAILYVIILYVLAFVVSFFIKKESTQYAKCKKLSKVLFIYGIATIAVTALSFIGNIKYLSYFPKLIIIYIIMLGAGIGLVFLSKKIKSYAHKK